jgi:hypothetical protein
VKQRRKTRTRRCDERCEKRPFVTYLLVVLRVYKDVLFNFYTCEWGERKRSYSFQLFLAWVEPQQTNKQTNKSQIQRETKGEVADKFLLYDVLHASASISCAIKLTSSLD